MSLNDEADDGGRSRLSKETLPPMTTAMSQMTTATTTAKTPGPAKLSLLNFSSQESTGEER